MREMPFARRALPPTPRARRAPHHAGNTHLQEPDMPRGDKSAGTDKQKRPAGAIDQKGGGGPQAEARSWASASKLHDGGKKAGSRRKLPSGPLGGSGRKTNLARSS